MIQKILDKIESKRGSNNFFDRKMIGLKDFVWGLVYSKKYLNDFKYKISSKISRKTITRLQVIQKIIDKTNAKTYLEIGVDSGSVFENIHCDFKIGVDPCSPYKKIFSQKEKYFKMKSDDFFEDSNNISLIKSRGLDVVFIDGLHEYKQVVRDVENSIKYLNNGGFIVLHDCNPEKEVYSIKAYSYEEAVELAFKQNMVWDGPWMGDVWKAILILKDRNDLDVCVLDCDCGLGIVKLNENYIKKEDIEKLDYVFLEKNRKKILNLKKPNYIDKLLK